MSDDERLRFAVPSATGELHGIDLAMLDGDDPDHRSLLIKAEHPELHSALDADREVIHLHGQTINVRLHLAMHEVVANQLWDNEPPEMWETAPRLLDAGYERHEVLQHAGIGTATNRDPRATPRQPRRTTCGRSQTPALRP